jgi:hypothetical protein
MIEQIANTDGFSSDPPDDEHVPPYPPFLCVDASR